MKGPTVPKHGRRLGLIGVSLTAAKLPKDDTRALSAVRDEFEAILDREAFLDGLPFSWITISIRFGRKDETVPTYGKVSAKYGDLPVSIEVDTAHVHGKAFEDLVPYFRSVVERVLLDVGKRHGRRLL